VVRNAGPIIALPIDKFLCTKHGRRLPAAAAADDDDDADAVEWFWFTFTEMYVM